MTRRVNIVNGYSLSATKKNPEISTQVNVWPIPNNGSFSILMTNDSDETNSNAEYKIYDIFGKEVKKGILKSDRLENVNLQSKGVFIINVSDISSKKIFHSQKIILE